MMGMEGSRKENELVGRESAARSRGVPRLVLDSVESKGKWKQITSSTFYGDSGPLLSKLYSVPDELQRHFEIYDGVEGVLGRGAYSSVFKIRSRRSGNVYALKVMSAEHFTCRGLGGQLRREIQLQSQCFHPNIVQLYKCLEHNGYVFLILEYVDTNLFTILHRKKKNRVIRVGARRNRYIPDDEDSEARENWALFSRSEVVSYLTQILKAVNYLHEMNIVHRDVKPENILVSCDGRVKLGDFGWCGDLCRRCTSMAGTFCYMAPEILRGERQTSKVDSWSIGIMLYELYVGSVPFVPRNSSGECEGGGGGGSSGSSQVISMLESIREISKEARPGRFPPDAWHLCCWLLRKSPSERASPIQALNHPFLADSNLAQAVPVASFRRPELHLGSTPRGAKQEVSYSPKAHGSLTFTTLPLVAVPTPRKASEKERPRPEDPHVKRMVTEIPASMYLYNNYTPQKLILNGCDGAGVGGGGGGGGRRSVMGARVTTKTVSTQSEHKLQQDPVSTEANYHHYQEYVPGQNRPEGDGGPPRRRDLSAVRQPPLSRDNFVPGYLQKAAAAPNHHQALLKSFAFDKAHQHGQMLQHQGATPSRDIYIPPISQIGLGGTGGGGFFAQDHGYYSKSVFKEQNQPTRYVSQPPIYYYEQQLPLHHYHQVRRNHYLP